MHLSYFHESHDYVFSVSQSLRCSCSTAVKDEGSVLYRSCKKMGCEAGGRQGEVGVTYLGCQKVGCNMEPVSGFFFLLLICYFFLLDLTQSDLA